MTEELLDKAGRVRRNLQRARTELEFFAAPIPEDSSLDPLRNSPLSELPISRESKQVIQRIVVSELQERLAVIEKEFTEL